MKKLFLFALMAFVFTASKAASPAIQKKLPVDSLEQYTGKFKFASGPISEAEVTLESGDLKILTSQGNATMKKTEEADVFTLVEYDGKATFVRNADKKITGIKIEVMGMVLEGTKE